jgi:hypothetical protein
MKGRGEGISMEVSIAETTALTSHYISCWQKGSPFRLSNGNPAPPSVQRVVQDNDLGWGGCQLNKHGLLPPYVDYRDLPEFLALLTRVAVYAQLNLDHRLLWSYVADVAGEALTVARWRDAVDAFANVVHLMLLRSPRIPAGPEGSSARKNINKHFTRVASDQHEIAGPLAFAVLEGVLKRKAGSHVQPDGRPVQKFTVSYADQSGKPKQRTFDPSNPRTVNRIHHLFLLVEIVNNSQLPPITAAVEKELRPWFLTGVYSEIDAHRNQMLHGSGYWTGFNGALLMLISALMLDEISAPDFDSAKKKLASRALFDEYDLLYPPEEQADFERNSP